MANKVALFLPNLRLGGAERVNVYLANGLVQRGYSVDMVLIDAVGEFLTELDARIRVVDLKSRRLVRAIPRLASYMRKERPAIILSALDHVNVGAIVAKRISRTRTPVVAAVHATRSMDAKSKSGVKERILRTCINWCYRRADAIVCVSRGVADDLIQVTGAEARRVRVIYNPVIAEGLRQRAMEPLDHPWFASGQPSVVVAIGRLSPPKDYPLLVRAFALLRRTHDVRLMIVGEGPERGRIEAVIAELGLSDCVALPGFRPNPYAYLSRAALFVLSSAWEALPTVLIEALAIGTPVVATDCKNGPREILHDGKYGPLVLVGDPLALSEAMAAALAAPRREVPEEVLRPYTLDYALDEYCRLIAEVTHG